MFITDSLILQMKEILTKELEQMVPELISFFARDLEKKFDVNKLIQTKLNEISIADLEKKCDVRIDRSVLQLKIFCAFLGGILGLLEILLLRITS